MRRVLAILLLLLPCARAAETIDHFDARIVVNRDGSLDVTETIRVTAEGNEIRRGIYRDFPTLYRGWLGLRDEVPFEVIAVTRDGQPEHWTKERRQNGFRIRIGMADVFLTPGVYEYRIQYRTSRQLGFFENHDELYWNVTGNDWAFPILQASACVELPPGAHVQSTEAFTGPSGARGTDFRTARRSGCDAFFETTRPLEPREGLTIVVTWPKGIVEPPERFARLQTLVASNPGVILGSAGLLVAFGFFMVLWVLHGRDPARGVIVPLYQPPSGLGPADVRYLQGLGTFDDTSFAAAVLGLAVQGGLEIRQPNEKSFSLVSRATDLPDSADEEFRKDLFRGGSPVELVQRNHAIFRSARQLLSKQVQSRNAPAFARNTGIWVAGLVVTLIPLGVSLLDANEPGGAVFMLVWLSIWSVGCAAISLGIVQAGRKNFFAAIPLALFGIPFFAGWIFGLFMLIQSASVWVSAIFVAGLILCAVFQHLLKRPSPEGQHLRDQILGFKRYLSVAEADRLNLENPPERTPELFERFLPYALALGVSQEWSEKFKDVLEAANYQPKWHTGSAASAMSAATLATSFGSSFSSAISSASTSPSSRSGSGGGGSSGGGGGGGGGGGW
ncbi:MAG: DUF2207 domain-containing protein [Terrimicrobiaceae bacterium]|nr:DUF2207 domain-containing protein [Terrimicrobiaceae bacterium]